LLWQEKSKKWNGILSNENACIADIKNVDLYFDKLFEHYELSNVKTSKELKYKSLIFEMAKELKIPAFVAISKQEERNKKTVDDFLFYREVLSYSKIDCFMIFCS
jgi:hypothetical protein